jgi:hypothetical protein
MRVKIMASSGGNRKSSSKRQKEHYQAYKLQNRAHKNKVKKLTRHCKKFPNDKESARNLLRIIKDGYKPRSKPLVPGSNPTIPKIKVGANLGETYTGPKTAGEQLSVLLGIPLPYKNTRKRKPQITNKKRRNVKKS